MEQLTLNTNAYRGQNWKRKQNKILKKFCFPHFVTTVNYSCKWNSIVWILTPIEGKTENVNKIKFSKKFCFPCFVTTVNYSCKWNNLLWILMPIEGKTENVNKIKFSKSMKKALLTSLNRIYYWWYFGWTLLITILN